MPELRPYRRILALLRFDASDAAIVNKALLLARLNRAELDVLHLIEPDGALDGGYPAVSAEATAGALETAALRRLEFLTAQLGAGEARCHARHGPVRQAFLRHVEAAPPDLVVMSSAPSGLPETCDRLILGPSPARSRGQRLLNVLGATGSRVRALGV
jgi:nucleotide-binding universal stress UspA family protein